MKVACTVWSGGKARDDIRGLPITIKFRLRVYSYVTHSGEGEGLLFYGSTILPFVDHFPKNTELYRIMTTKPQELKKKEDE